MTTKIKAKTTVQFIEWICNDINDACPGTCTFECGDYDKDSSMIDPELAFLGFEGPWCRVSAGQANWFCDCDKNNFVDVLGQLRAIALFLGASTTC